MLCEAAPVDQVFPFGWEELKITLSPSQKVVGPFGVMIGAAGAGFTITFTEAEVAVQVPPAE